MARTPENNPDLTPEQMGDASSFFLEKHDQEKYGAERPQIDGAVPILGQDPFEIALRSEQLPQRGLLVHAEVAKGYEGVISVYDYKGLKVSLNDQRPEGYDQIRMHADFGPTKELQLAYENPNYFYKHTEPYNRMSVTSYMGVGFGELDITYLSDDGRLLVAKRQFNMAEGLSTSFDRSERELGEESRQREVLALFDEGDYEGAMEAVRTVMSKLIGMTPEDVEQAIQQVKGKLVEDKR